MATTNYCIRVEFKEGHDYLRPHPQAKRYVFSSGDAAMDFLAAARESFGRKAKVRLVPIDRPANCGDVFAMNDARDAKKKGKRE